ncbi:hypothetical protein BHE74_00055948, partial [Ensete ventricosum]
ARLNTQLEDGAEPTAKDSKPLKTLVVVVAVASPTSALDSAGEKKWCGPWRPSSMATSQLHAVKSLNTSSGRRRFVVSFLTNPNFTPLFSLEIRCRNLYNCALPCSSKVSPSGWRRSISTCTVVWTP